MSLIIKRTATAKQDCLFPLFVCTNALTHALMLAYSSLLLFLYILMALQMVV